MKPFNWKTCTAEQLWKNVAWHLEKSGIDVVLVGGGVVSIYSKGIYESGDLDFVIRNYLPTNSEQALKEIGFKKEGQSYFHPECRHLYVEFVSPPVAIGSDDNIRPREIPYQGQVLKILSPTDSVRDRLASYIYFHSKDSLEQAVLVAKNQKVDMKKIESWCRGEGGTQEFREFLSLTKTKTE